MTDREKLVWMARKLGTLKKVTVQYAYISTMRYEFDAADNIVRVRERIPKSHNGWRDVE